MEVFKKATLESDPGPIQHGNVKKRNHHQGSVASATKDDANLHAEQAQQQHNLAAECQHVAVEEAGNAHGERRFVIMLFILFSLIVILMYVVEFFFQLLYGLWLCKKPRLAAFWRRATSGHLLLFGVVGEYFWYCRCYTEAYKDESLWVHWRPRFKRLFIIMDNCGGQNKNKYVLYLALLLVQLKSFLTVEIIFYIRGHTKNACDQLFNQLMKHWHKRQVFTSHATVGLRRYSAGHTYKWKYGRVDRKGLLCVFAALF
jgi:hypothetical protein